LIAADVQTFPLGALAVHDPPDGACGAAKHLLVRVVASVRPRPFARCRSEERVLLSRAPASTDSFRCISSMPTPRAFFGLEEPFPDGQTDL